MNTESVTVPLFLAQNTTEKTCYRVGNCTVMMFILGDTE